MSELKRNQEFEQSEKNVSWGLVKSTINQMNRENAKQPRDFLSNYFQESVLKLDKESNLDINEEGRFNSFEQKDGTKVEVKRNIGQENLHFIDDVTFKNKNGEDILKLSSMLPKGYSILEEARRNCDFMLSEPASVIVMTPGFLESLGGRITFLHELGHAYDYEKKPKTRGELIDNIKGTAVEQREKDAWDMAKTILKSFREKGLNFLPESLENFEETLAWDQIAKECTEQHNYQELKEAA